MRPPRQFRWNGGLGTITVPGTCSPQQLKEWLAEKMKAVEHAIKHGLPLAALGK